MDGPIWLDLLESFAIVAIIVSVATQTYEWRSRWSPLGRRASLGLIFGVGTILLMLVPFALVPGVRFDLRAALLALAGLFGGPVAAAIAVVCAAVYRGILGGVGAAPGILTIVLAALIGVGGFMATSRRTMGRLDIAVVAAIAGISQLVGIAILPDGVREQVLAAAAVPMVVLVGLATLLSGAALLAERRRVEQYRENLTYRTIIEALPDSLNVKDSEGRFIAANPATANLMGAVSAGDLIGRTDFDFYKDGIAQAFRADEIDAMQATEPRAFDQKFTTPDGRQIWLSTLKVPLRDEKGAVSGIITLNRDVTERKRLESELARSEQKLESALSNIADGFAIFDESGVLLMRNERYASLFPLTASLRTPGTDLRTILRASVERGEQLGVAEGEVWGWIERVMASLRIPLEEEVELVNGRWLGVRSNPLATGGAMVIVTDITSRKLTERELLRVSEELRVLASTDALSNLMNRRAFDETLTREIARTQRSGVPLSLLMMDIDRFKSFNDVYGHPAGDACIRKVAAAIAGVLKRPGDVAARYGGEEMAVILPETDVEGAAHVAEEMRRALEALHIEHQGSEKGIVSVSIGVAGYAASDRDRSSADIVSRADKLLYEAKRNGRDRVVTGGLRAIDGGLARRTG